MKLFIQMLTIFGLSICITGQFWPVNIGVCRENTKTTCGCGYETHVVGSSTARKCKYNEFCRRAKTEGFECDKGTTFKGQSLEKSLPRLTVCRSVKGCSCGDHLTNQRTCSFGQWCQPTWEGFKCVDVNNSIKFICPNIDIGELRSCTCSLSDAKKGKQCNLYSTPLIVNNADNNLDPILPGLTGYIVSLVMLKKRDVTHNNPSKFATSKDVSHFPEFFVLENNDLTTYTEYDLVIESNHYFDSYGFLQIDTQILENTIYNEWKNKDGKLQIKEGWLYI